MRKAHFGLRVLAIGLVLGSALILGGCPKKPVARPMAEPQAQPVAPPTPAPAPVQAYTPPPPPAPAPAAPVAPPPAPAPAPAVPAVPPAVASAVPGLEDVFFDFDKSDLKSEAREALERNARVLKANASLMMTIEGHCDERGTNEYNLGLGERRAASARDYLVALGVPASRLQTISYGEERPFAQGHDESAWSKNRRGHFIAQ